MVFQDSFQFSQNSDMNWSLGSIGSPPQVSTGVGVDFWNPYTPVNYQGPLTNDYSTKLYNTSTSPDSTVRAASTVSSPDPTWAQQNLLRDPIARDNPGRTISRDFIEMSPFIYLEGDPVVVGNLLHFVGDHLNRQFTSSTDQLCALYALETSLQSMFPQQSPTFDNLRAIWLSQEYTELAMRQTETIGIDFMRGELFATSNLSVHVVLLILRLLGPLMGRVFALGICEMVRVETTEINGAPVQTFAAYCLSSSDDEPSNTTVWLHNDRYEETGAGVSHWSGFGIDLQAQSGIFAPKIVLSNPEHAKIASHVSYSDSSQPPILTFTPLASSHPATDSSYFTSDTPHSAISRIGSVEPSTGGFDSALSPSSYDSLQSYAMSRLNSADSITSNVLSIPSRSPRGRSASVTSSSLRDDVQCKNCGTVVLRKSLK